ncbi:hypothetical protein P3X46_013786 [Hevea brasiliensis]|uniref:F-box domain-containing protein n=1 Tax=Hevea brasiliensis TaxID=3981 RepID=A0ABQ9M8H8_HEVBR|nr:hypothetical protein P3X46_013786 [Hevea brasiliensis]
MDKRIEAVDYISELPEHILHHILSFLPIKQITRTSALSKTLFQVWKTSPILEFNFYALFNGNQDRYYCQDFEIRERNIQQLYNFVEQILLSRCKQMDNLIKFTLVVTFIYERPEMVSTMDRWIGYALKSNAKHLKIQVGPSNDDENYKYCVPQTVLNAMSIQVLDLSHCKLHLPSIGNIKLPFLKKLSLTVVFADDDVISKLIVGSPLIEDMSFITCYGIKSLQIFDLVNLIQFCAKDIVHFERLKMETPNLHSFTLQGPTWPSVLKNYIIPCEVRKLTPPPLHNVKELKLSMTTNRHRPIAELVDAMLWISPHLESLDIINFNVQSSFKFSYQKQIYEEECICYKSTPISCWKNCIKQVKIKQNFPAVPRREDECFMQVREREERNFAFSQDIWENISDSC